MSLFNKFNATVYNTIVSIQGSNDCSLVKKKKLTNLFLTWGYTNQRAAAMARNLYRKRGV